MTVAGAASPFSGTARFRVRRPLGAGGFGMVYEVDDLDSGARLALKTLARFDAASLYRFKKEFRVFADIHHRNLVRVHELVSEGAHWFFTMDLVDGVDWMTYVRRVDASASSAFDETLDAIEVPGRVVQPHAQGGSVDVARLRSTLVELVEGLSALHRERVVHCDVKPANVLVTPAGRVVILDFGLATVAVTEGASRTDVYDIAGTPAYMAPEQATGADVSPATDWYALGTMLFEALTGTVPFVGAPVKVLLEKQDRTPPRPSTLAPNTPIDLDDLCVRLLETEPDRRPDVTEIQRRLGGTSIPAGVAQPSRAVGSVRFVGRAEVLRRLGDAYAVSRSGSLALVRLHGSSGMGKSAAAKAFVERADGSPVVLQGRCFQRESVPYKAFDEVVDSLTRYLLTLPREEVAALMPRDVAALARIFPVLYRVPAVTDAPRRGMDLADPQLLRKRAFAALRELLTRLTDRRAVIVVLDDVQWGDADSAAILDELASHPEAPPLLLILSFRSEEAKESPLLTAFERQAKVAGVRGERFEIALEPLAKTEALELAQHLLGGNPETVGLAPSLAEECFGSPFFLGELAQYSQTDAGKGGRSAVRLEDLIALRISQLTEDARHVLCLTCLSGGSVGRGVALRASALEESRFAQTVGVLRLGNLVRLAGQRGELVEPFHDRIREAVAADLPADVRQQAHRALAEALVADASEGAETADPEVLALHWRGAGDFEKALRYTVLAADRARSALAFDHAAQLYQGALDLGGLLPDVERELHAKLGDALANAGRGARAAEELLVAAEGAPAADALDRRRRAAEQLLRAGHFDQGLATIRAVLASIGMSLPATPLLALLIFVWGRLVVLLRGLGFREKDLTEVAASDLARIDMYWSVTSGLALIDTTRAAAFQTRHLLLALRTGEPFRVSRALSLEIAFRGRAGGKKWKQTEALMVDAEALAARTKRPEAVGLVMMSCGLAHYYGGVNLRRSVELFDRAVEVLAECGDVAWELATTHTFALSAIAFLGEMRELDARRDAHLRTAVERGDLYFHVNLRIGHSHMVWLAKDAPEAGREDLEDAMRRWSKQGFHIEHFTAMVARVNTEAYLGRGLEAYEAATSQWEGLRRSLLLTVQSIRTVGWYARGRAALAGAIDVRADRSVLVAAARRDARALAKEAWRWSIPLAALLEAGAEKAGRGDDERVLRFLNDAARGFAAIDMNLHAAVARRQAGRLVGGDEGAELVTAADAWMREHGVVNPEAMTAAFAPGFPR